jgi:hypothetical protein
MAGLVLQSAAALIRRSRPPMSLIVKSLNLKILDEKPFCRQKKQTT